MLMSFAQERLFVPGDVVVGDIDGVVVIKREDAAEVRSLDKSVWRKKRSHVQN